MRLVIFNGSPRGKKSNTRILMDHFSRGFMQTGIHTVEVAYLNRTRETGRHLELFKQVDQVILAFPLYTDAMPGIVKHFIEALQPYTQNRENPALGFVVQSGFPEPVHSRPLACFLEKLTRRLGCTHTGTVIRGGVEGVRIQPPWMTRKLFSHFHNLGKDFGVNGCFNKEIIDKLTPREKLSRSKIMFYRIGSWFGLTNLYWNMMLKKNNSFENRFARPYRDFKIQ